MRGLDPAEFAALMARFAPFEARPHLAIAVSGGADSLALALLADAWARPHGGLVTALTVDHRLRPGSADEAAQVALWLRRRSIAQATLVRDGPGFAGDVQAEARAARYRLLEGWCEGAGVLHLLTGHHREDQAETVLLRLARGSGLDGLAGIPAVTERRDCRILRPLLAIPRARLAATLEAQGQAWVEDPSNRDPAYARVRLRQAEAVLAAEGLTAARLCSSRVRRGFIPPASPGSIRRRSPKPATSWP
jgi:tRNA(Ile)-lysidine synthase